MLILAYWGKLELKSFIQKIQQTKLFQKLGLKIPKSETLDSDWSKPKPRFFKKLTFFRHSRLIFVIKNHKINIYLTQFRQVTPFSDDFR